MKRTAVLLLAFLSLLACAVSGAASEGARLVKYSETDVIPIHAKLRFSTLIVLPAEEEIRAASTL